MRRWTPENSEQQLFLNEGNPGAGIGAIVFESATTFWSAGYDGQIILRDDVGEYLLPPICTPGRFGVLDLIAVDSGATLIAGTMNGLLWFRRGATEMTPIAGPKGWVRSVVAINEGSVVAAGDDGTLWVWSVGDQAAKSFCDVSLPGVLKLDVTTQGQTRGLIAVDQASHITCFSLESGAVLWERDFPDVQDCDNFALADDLLVVSGPSGVVRGLNPEDGGELWSYATEAGVSSILITHNSVHTAHQDLKMWRWSREGALLEIDDLPFAQWVENMSYFEDRTALAGSSGTIALTHPDVRLDPLPLTQFMGTLHPAKPVFVTASTKEVVFWDRELCAKTGSFELTGITSIAVLENSDLIICRINNTIAIYDGVTGTEKYQMPIEIPYAKMACLGSDLIAEKQNGDIVRLDPQSLEESVIHIDSEVWHSPATVLEFGRWMVWFEPDGAVVEGAFLDNYAMILHRDGHFCFTEETAEHIRIWDGEHMRRLS